jgi:F0F1-type ATP synthase assembly protein I
MIPSGQAPTPQNRSQYVANLSIAGVAGQVGCVTVIIVFGALFAGIWLDRWLQTRPLFTVGLLLGSVPVTIGLMYWLVKKAVAKIQPAGPTQKQRKEEDSGE